LTLFFQLVATKASFPPESVTDSEEEDPNYPPSPKIEKPPHMVAISFLPNIIVLYCIVLCCIVFIKSTLGGDQKRFPHKAGWKDKGMH